jgi:hypothetical protein
MKLYTVERHCDGMGWTPVLEATASPLQYCKGYVACSDSYYPSPPVRIVEYETANVVHETAGRGEVHAN